MFDTALKKKRVVGLVLLSILLALFLLFNRIDKLDTVREDLASVTSPEVECFQGFCIEREPESTLLSRWWNFSLTYLKLVALGMTFAFLIAGLTEAFLFPTAESRSFSGGGIKGSLKGLVVGSPMSLCSACIVPVASAFRRRGAGIETTLAITQGSSTLNLPAMVMAVLVFTPMLAGSRIVLSVVGALLLGPLVATIVGQRGRGSAPVPIVMDLSEQDASPWGQALKEGFRDWTKASLKYLIRLGPIMVLAGFASALAIQWVSPETVETYLGDNISGIAIAATLGILINVPLLFEIPLVAALLLVGMGTAPAVTLLFTAAAGGPITFWGLAKVMPKKAIATFATATWALGLVGGLGVLALSPLLPGVDIGLLPNVASARGEGSSLSVPAEASPQSSGIVGSSDSLRSGSGGPSLVVTSVNTPEATMTLVPPAVAPLTNPLRGGSGFIELLARDMTTDLHRITDNASSIASKTGEPVFSELVTGGVSFGWIEALPDGTVDTSRVVATRDAGNNLESFDPGFITSLAHEMTADLQAIRDNAIPVASKTGAPVFVELVTRGVSLGWIRVLPNGSVDTSRVAGFD